MSRNDSDHVIGLGKPSLEEYENVKDERDAIRLESRVIAALRYYPPFKDCKSEWRSCFRFVLALDISYSTNSNLSVAAGILYDTKTNETVVQNILSRSTSSFEYVPGLLAFREVPLLGKLVKSLLADERYENLIKQHEPANNIVLMCDGNGTLHPRLCGLACHLGLLFELPAFGVGKTYLVGAPKRNDHTLSILEHNQGFGICDKVDFHSLKRTLPYPRQSMIPLYVQEQLAGHLVRTQDNVNPLFVSSGMSISQIDAVKITLSLCTDYRQPEPIRIVDHLGRMEIRKLEQDLL